MIPEGLGWNSFKQDLGMAEVALKTLKQRLCVLAATTYVPRDTATANHDYAIASEDGASSTIPKAIQTATPTRARHPGKAATIHLDSPVKITAPVR